jgi:hypothetical protein
MICRSAQIIDAMEHRAGIEPANTGFADSAYPLLSAIYGNSSVLKTPVKYAKEYAQWC